MSKHTEDHDSTGEAVQEERCLAPCEGFLEDTAQPGDEGRDGEGSHQE